MSSYHFTINVQANRFNLKNVYTIMSHLITTDKIHLSFIQLLLMAIILLIILTISVLNCGCCKHKEKGTSKKSTEEIPIKLKSEKYKSQPKKDEKHDKSKSPPKKIGQQCEVKDESEFDNKSGTGKFKRHRMKQEELVLIKFYLFQF